jgi:hypothetical protein
MGIGSKDYIARFGSDEDVQVRAMGGGNFSVRARQDNVETQVCNISGIESIDS